MSKTRSYILIITGLILIITAFVLKTSFIFPRELWLILGLISICAGTLLILKQKFTALTTPASPPKDWEKIRQTGHHIRITPDNCTVKHRLFQQDAEEELLPFQAAGLDALFNTHHESDKQTIQQTYIVMEQIISGINYKFVSHPTALDPVSVKLRIEQKGGDLYIDKANPTVYFFQLPF